MKRKLLFLTIMIALLFACPSKIKNSSVTLRMAVDKQYFSYFMHVVDDFQQEYTNVLIEIIDIASMSENDTVDIVMLNPVNGVFDRNLFVPLTLNPSEYTNKATFLATNQQELYILPLSLNVSLLIYNKDYVTEAPTFLSQLDPLEWAAPYMDFYYAAGLMQSVGFNPLEKNETEFNLTSSEARKAGQIIQKLYASEVEHWTLMREVTNSDNLIMNAFYTGNISYMISDSSHLSNIMQHNNNVGVAPIPSWDGSHFYRPLTTVKGLGIHVDSEHQAIAHDFITFLAQEEYAHLWFELTQEISTHKSVTYPKDSIASIINEALKLSTPMPNTQDIEKISLTLEDALKHIANGQDVAQALDNAQQLIIQNRQDIYL